MESLTNLSDQELITSFSEGSTDAISALVIRHKNKIFTAIYLLVKDKYLAEDLFQDTFFKVIDTIRNGKYSEEGKFLPWAMRIAHNLCIDHFRKVKRSPSVQINEDPDFTDKMGFSAPGADEQMIQNQSHSGLRKLIGQLPDEQQEVIIMRHYAEMTFKEIAALTNCSINTALGRMRYALLNLRKMMASDPSMQHG